MIENLPDARALSKCTSTFTLMALMLVCSVATAEAADAPTPTQPALRTELLAMLKEDQRYRDFTAVQAMEAGARNAFIAEGIEKDLQHTARLKQMVAAHGWPTEAMVGRDGTTAAFLIVQHADRDPDFQQEMLPCLEEAARRGDIAWGQLAYLTDRIRVSQDRPQRYGTQYLAVKNAAGALVMDDRGQVQMRVPVVEDIEHLDERRLAAGLESWSTYESKAAGLQGRSSPATRPESVGEYCAPSSSHRNERLCQNAAR